MEQHSKRMKNAAGCFSDTQMWLSMGWLEFVSQWWWHAIQMVQMTRLLVKITAWLSDATLLLRWSHTAPYDQETVWLRWSDLVFIAWHDGIVLRVSESSDINISIQSYSILLCVLALYALGFAPCGVITCESSGMPNLSHHPGVVHVRGHGLEIRIETRRERRDE